MVKVAYICDQKKDCARFENCQVRCKHTFDEFHAVNGIVQDVKDLRTEKYKKLGVINEVAYYEEVVK